ncbi:MAG: hypothetical protein ACOYKZ_00940 [Chlamydiia bacterium]
MQTISLGTALRTGWRLYKKDFSIWGVIGLIYTVSIGFPSLVALANLLQVLCPEAQCMPWMNTVASPNLHPVVRATTDWGGWLLLAMTPGMMSLATKAVFGGSITWSDFLRGYRGLFLRRWAVQQILVMLLVLLGIAALLIPGIILATGWMFAGFFVYRFALKGRESMAASWRLTKGLKWDLFGAIWTMTWLGLLSYFSLGLAFFVIGPLVMLAQGSLFRQCVEQSAKWESTVAAK